VQGLVGHLKGPILCLVGPPGVGKTSLGRSIARSTGRKFVRVSLGGVRDEAEIRGHRRTYIGALPGKVIQSMKKAGSGNPVFLLDEVDKMSTDFRGDPSAALLEVLDPEQNTSFNDHYLGRRLRPVEGHVHHHREQPRADSASAPGSHGDHPHRGLHRAREAQHREALPDPQAARGERPAGVEHHAVRLGDVISLIRHYTKEAGVRSLEREIAAVCRKVAVDVVKKGRETHVKVTSKSLVPFLGPPRFRYGKAEHEHKIGLVTGLAWTDLGGELLATEVQVLPGKGKLTITGRLGEVMQESAQAALSYVRSRAEELGLERDFYQKIDIHIHVPEGAIPKDGPVRRHHDGDGARVRSHAHPVRHDVAMTGEITLRGFVLPIGGLKEKVLAAHRGGIRRVLIPIENEKDIQEIPSVILKSIEIETVEHMDQVLRKALVLENPEEYLRRPAADVAQQPAQPPPTQDFPGRGRARHGSDYALTALGAVATSAAPLRVPKGSRA
jgi:ATP-dependent Lon protease